MTITIGVQKVGLGVWKGHSFQKLRDDYDDGLTLWRLQENGGQSVRLQEDSSVLTCFQNILEIYHCYKRLILEYRPMPF